MIGRRPPCSRPLDERRSRIVRTLPTCPVRGSGQPRSQASGSFRQFSNVGSDLNPLNTHLRRVASGPASNPSGESPSTEGLGERNANNLIDCEVVLWPDNDKPGFVRLEKVVKLIGEDGCVRSLHKIQPPTELEPGGDIVDAVQNLGWDRERIEQLIERAQPVELPKATRFASHKQNGGKAGSQPPDEARRLPEIDAGNQDLPSVAKQSWGALLAANQPPRLFRYGGLPSRIETDDEGGPLV